MTVRPLVVGLGSSHGDDQAGWLVVERLQKRGLSSATTRIAGNPTELWDCGDRDCDLLICDACSDGMSPGTLRRWQWPRDPFPAGYGGTHDFPLCEVLTMGAGLGCLPAHATVWTISGESFQPGANPCEAVRVSAFTLADRLWESFFHA
jgi:hydrogenase maturation protease